MAPSATELDAEDPPQVHLSPPGFMEQTQFALKPYRELLVEDEDPFYSFRGKTPLEKFYLAISHVFPILRWLPQYKRKYLFGDIIGGLTITSLAMPQDLIYAKLANLPPVNGLYSSFLPPIIYGLMGSSMHIAIGPVAVVSLALGTALKEEYPPFLDAKKTIRNPDYYDLALTSTLYAGILSLALGTLRLGFIVDFLSHSVVIGFTAGAAITIALLQLRELLAYPTFTTKADIVSILRSAFATTDEFKWRPFVIGVVFLTYLLILKFLASYTKGKRLEKLFFFLQALGPLTSVIISTFFVYIIFKSEKEARAHGFRIVGHIKKGINPSSIHHLHFNGDKAKKAIKPALVAGLIALTEAIAIGRTFAALKGYHINGNQEMVALGTGNVLGSFISCYITTGSFSRSAVNYNSGANTPVTQFIMGFIIMLTLVVITPLFKFTPNAVLSAVVIFAVIGLIDIPGAIKVFKTDKIDFVALVAAFFGVLFISIEVGILIAVFISILRVLVAITRPHTAILGRIFSTNVYRSVSQYPEAITHPGLLIIRIDSSIYFTNSNYIREKVLRLSERYESDVPLQNVILDLTPVADIDTTGILALTELYTTLKKNEISLGISNPSKPVLWKLQTAGFVEKIGLDFIFVTVNEAVKVTTNLIKKQSTL